MKLLKRRCCNVELPWLAWRLQKLVNSHLVVALQVVTVSVNKIIVDKISKQKMKMTMMSHKIRS